MKNLSSWLIAFFALMYWAFRIVVTFTYSMGMEFIIQPIDDNGNCTSICNFYMHLFYI